MTILVLGAIVAVFAKHNPSQVEYELSDSGLRIGDKAYSYGSFKSFSIIQDGAFKSIDLTPLKRFKPPISVYFDPKDQDKISAIIGAHLPYEERQLDTVDRLSRRLRL